MIGCSLSTFIEPHHIDKIICRCKAKYLNCKGGHLLNFVEPNDFYICSYLKGEQ